MTTKKKRPTKVSPTTVVEGNAEGVDKDLAVSRRESPPSLPSLPSLPSKRIQPGGGYLRTGNPGNKGGPGRTPEEIKGTMRQIIDEHGIPWVRGVLSDDPAYSCEPGVKVRLLEIFTRASIGTQTEIKVEGGMVLLHDTNQDDNTQTD